MAIKQLASLSLRLGKAEQLHFAQQLLTLLHSGLPLLNAIGLLHRSSTKSRNDWLPSIYKLLAKGNSLSACLKSQGNRFPSEFINLILISERSGDLCLALTLINEQLESQIELQRKIKQALSYPLITLASSMLLIGVMMLWVIPIFEEVFSHFHAELPAATQVLVNTSVILRDYFLYI